MQVFIYTGQNNKQGELLRTYAEKQVPKDQLVSIEEISDLEPTFRLLLKSQDIIILYAHSESDMDAFLKIRNLMQDIKLILVLSEESADLIIKGHLLRPRFLDIIEGNNFTNVNAVLSKMLKAQSSPKKKIEKKQMCSEGGCVSPSLC